MSYIHDGITSNDMSVSSQCAAALDHLASYASQHAGKDTESNIVRAKGGFTTTEEAAQREAFAAAYGEAHEGWDARESG